MQKHVLTTLYDDAYLAVQLHGRWKHSQRGVGCRSGQRTYRYDIKFFFCISLMVSMLKTISVQYVEDINCSLMLCMW